MRNRRKNVLLPWLLLMAMACVLSACGKQDGLIKNIDVSQVAPSNCKTYYERLASKGVETNDSIDVRYDNGVVYVKHHNLAVNCGFKEVVVSVSVSGDTIRVTETGVPENANCVCEIDNSFQINNVPHGTYVLVVENCVPTAYTRMFNF